MTLIPEKGAQYGIESTKINLHSLLKLLFNWPFVRHTAR